MSSVPQIESPAPPPSPPPPKAMSEDQRDNAAAPATTAPPVRNFEVVIEQPKTLNRDEFKSFPAQAEQNEEEDDIGEIEPAYYYENQGVPVFTPTMDQFRSFKKFVDKINHYGMQSGIVKIIPPKEWIDSLPPLDEKVRDIKIKNPIKQHIEPHLTGGAGTYRQTNIEKQRTYNLPEWKQLCEGSDHQPPARRGERRRGTAPIPKAPKRITRGRRTRKSTYDEDDEDEIPVKPPTPQSPPQNAEDSSRESAAPEEAHVDGGGRQLRKKRVFKTAKQRAAEREIADEEAFDGFDYRFPEADQFTPERCEELEKAYWKSLTYNSPLYGADMPGSLFDDRTTSWNVAKLENILDYLGEKLPGVNTAYLYLGMWKSTFAWHLEDMDLYSINYIHFGAPKQWYSISRKDKPRFEKVMKSIYPNDAKNCTEFLRHKTFLISPSLLAQHGIKVNKLVHHQGEFVITFPYGYHSGYNLGYNCAESVNFATESWLEYGRTAKKCECIEDAVFVDVERLERKMRGEPTDDEEDYDGETDMTDDNEETLGSLNGDLPTPPDSVRGKAGGSSNRRKKDKARKAKARVPKSSRAPCFLCPNDSPYEQLLPIENSDKLAHRLCAIYTPETYFKYDDADPTREVVANVDMIPKARMMLKCFYCRSTRGSCFQCCSKKCHRSYHATCAAAAGVLVSMVDHTVEGEDGKPCPQMKIDFQCKYHRPARPRFRRDAEGQEECEKYLAELDNDGLIQRYARSLLARDVIQMQLWEGDVFAGVVLENRPDEGTVLVETVPKGDVIEIQWKWILAEDPSKTDFPDAIITAPLRADPNYRPPKIELPDRNENPQPEDIFIGKYKWGELIVEDIPRNPEQKPIDPAKNYWYYLGEQSTECIARWTEDPKKRVANPAAEFLPPKKAAPKKPRPSAARTIPLQYIPHPNGGGQWQPQGCNAYQSQPQHPPNWGWQQQPQAGYRPQFHGGSPSVYAPVNSIPPIGAYHQQPRPGQPPSGQPQHQQMAPVQQYHGYQYQPQQHQVQHPGLQQHILPRPGPYQQGQSSQVQQHQSPHYPSPRHHVLPHPGQQHQGPPVQLSPAQHPGQHPILPHPAQQHQGQRPVQQPQSQQPQNQQHSQKHSGQYHPQQQPGPRLPPMVLNPVTAHPNAPPQHHYQAAPVQHHPQMQHSYPFPRSPYMEKPYSTTASSPAQPTPIPSPITPVVTQSESGRSRLPSITPAPLQAAQKDPQVPQHPSPSPVLLSTQPPTAASPTSNPPLPGADPGAPSSSPSRDAQVPLADIKAALATIASRRAAESTSSAPPPASPAPPPAQA